MSRRLTNDEFIERARKVHGDKYDYSKVDYTNNSTKVCIICSIHGEFWQTPDKHMGGQGCPLCSKTKKSNTEEFLEKARKVHGSKYGYSKVEYINNKTKVCIICPIHGEFWQTPHNHLKGEGCPICGSSNQDKVISYDEFIKRARIIHGKTYEYCTKEEYVNIQEKIPIYCKEHGEFLQRPYSHLYGDGCPICASIKNGLNKRLSTEEFINKSKLVHGDKYDYSKVEYITAKEKVCIICPKHGEFWQSPDKHMQGCGCPKCNRYISKDEQYIYEYVCSLVGKDNVIQGDRKILNGKELDIYIPLYNIAIEYNGLYWHNSKIINKEYHLEKLEECNNKGIRLLQIFEDEFKNTPSIVLNKIAHILHHQLDLPRIMARKCNIKEIRNDIAKDFLNEYHIQGFASSTIYLGAYYNENLVGVMSFKKEDKDGLKWELNRFASDYNYICQGIGGKLFKYFVRKYKPIEIKSFADRRWTTNKDENIYVRLGFSFDEYTNIDYRYYNPKIESFERIHKFNFRKTILNKKYGLPLSMSEREMTEELGYERIYDCGLIKYIWKS